MLVRILKRTFSGAEYCPEQKVLKLGGEGSTGVETLEFELPEDWYMCSSLTARCRSR